MDDTVALQDAVTSAGRTPRSTVSIAAGTCSLTNHLSIRGNFGITVTGAGQAATKLVQHNRVNIFEIQAAGTTVENLTADTATYNTTYPPIPHDPDPGTLYSGASQTTVRNYTSVSGTGYGFRLTGPSPCDSHQVTGDVVDTVNVTNSGTAGFSSIDIDCGVLAVVRNAVVHGGSVTPFEDATSVISGLTYSKGPYGITCEPAWQVTAGTSAITNVVTDSGWGRVLSGASVTVTNEQWSPGNACATK